MLLLRSSIAPTVCRTLFVLLIAFAAAAIGADRCLAQCGGGGQSRRQSVGGVFINAEGVVFNATVAQSTDLRDFLKQAMHEQPADLKTPTELRKVSLRQLDEALAESLGSGKPLSEEMQYLAGLQNIRYVLVYPEARDVVLVGYAEGWTVNAQGFVVGQTTGKPVLLLDDLIVALRAARRGAGGAISCSIDPTESGLATLRQYAGTLRNINDLSVERVERSLGDQKISITGVPPTSHFARVLVAADYKMKRLGMKLDASPVKGLPSYIDLVSGGGRGMQDMTPRWWLTPKFSPLLTDADGLAWEMPRTSVVTMTEDTLFAADGSKSQTGKVSTAGQRWAAMMTDKYDELAKKEPIFAELRNCMDLAVVATLMAKERLADRAGCSLSVLDDPTQLAAEEYSVPRTTPTKANVTKKGSSYVVSASGGVEIHPGEAFERRETISTLSPIRSDAAIEHSHWWWN
jgi:hypothetical protein